MPTPTSNPSPGLGTVLSYSTDGNSYSNVNGLFDIEGPNEEMGARDVTFLGSTNKQQLPTLPDPGEITFSIWYDPSDAGHIALYGAYQAGTLLYFKEMYHTASAHGVTYQGWLKSFDRKGMTPEETLTADLSVQLYTLPEAVTS